MEIHSPFAIIPDVPSALSRQLRAGTVDCALVSSIEYQRLGAGFAFDKTLAVAADREVWSIRFFVADKTQSFADTLQTLRVIYTDAASRSSVAQLEVVLKYLRVDLPLREIDDANDAISRIKPGEAVIAIGDTALKNIERPSFDLQREYYAMFQRSFVYAIWVYRKELAERLTPLLAAAYRYYQQSAAAYRRAAMQRFGFSEELTTAYLTRVIRYELNPERLADLDFFFNAATPM